MKSIVCHIDQIRFEFSLEHDPYYVLSERFDSLNTSEIKRFKANKIQAYNIVVAVTENDRSFQFFDSGFLFDCNEDESIKELQEFLEESYFLDDLQEKLKLYKTLGSF